MFKKIREKMVGIFLLLLGIGILDTIIQGYLSNVAGKISNPLHLIGIVLFGLVVIIFAFLFVISGLSIIFPVILNLIPKSKCAICSQKTSDALSNEDFTEHYCRPHLLEKFSNTFLKNSHKLLMLDFIPTQDYESYEFYDLNNMKKDFSKEDRAKVHELINKIDSKTCSVCRKEAKILFIPKEIFNPESNPYLRLHQLDTFPELYLCRKDALEKILPGLRSYKGKLDLWVSSKNEGLQIINY
jgi:hypothetical protein